MASRSMARLERARRDNVQLATALRRLGRHDAANRLIRCQRVCRSGSGRRFTAHCHMPLCRYCNLQRRRQKAAIWLPSALLIRHPHLLTLTLRNARHLPRELRRLVVNLQKMRRLRLFRQRCTGGFYCAEFSYSAAYDAFHPHLHCLLDVEGLSASWFRQVWKDYTTAYIVHLRPVPREQVERVFLYMLKPTCSSLEPRAVSEVYGCLTKTPLFRGFGEVTRRGRLCRCCREKPQIAFGERCDHPME